MTPLKIRKKYQYLMYFKTQQKGCQKRAEIDNQSDNSL